MADQPDEQELVVEPQNDDQEPLIEPGQRGNRLAQRRLGQRNAQMQPLQFLRQPPLLRKESDIDLYLRRFLAYTDSIQAREDDLVNLLINSMSDEILLSVERHLHNMITYDELAAILRRELGEGMENQEEYKAKLRKAVRAKNESVRSFYIRIWQYARKSYEDPAIRANALRDAFICGIADPQIAARLREQHGLDNEELLEHAVLLMNCKNASQNRLTQSSTVNFLTDETRTGDTRSKALDSKLDRLIDLMTANVVSQQANKSSISTAQPEQNPSEQYAYNNDPQTNIDCEMKNEIRETQHLEQEYDYDMQLNQLNQQIYSYQQTNWTPYNNYTTQHTTEDYMMYDNNYNNTDRDWNQGHEFEFIE